jgi:hypothetical protein
MNISKLVTIGKQRRILISCMIFLSVIMTGGIYFCTPVQAATSPLLIVSAAPPPATAGSAYSHTLSAVGGTPPYTWGAAIIAPDEQTNGLHINTSTGEITGTPFYTGTTTLIVKVTDLINTTYRAQYDFVVNGAGSNKGITNNPSSGTQGVAYPAFTFATTWSGILGCSPNLYGVEGRMPPGLEFNSLAGWLTGTPTTAGQYTFRLYGSAGSTLCSPEPIETNIQTFTINIAPATSPTSPAGASNWIKNAGNPVLTPSASGWDSQFVSSPSVIRVGSNYFMYYEGQDSATGVRQIGMATSPNGVNWTKSQLNPVLKPGGAGTWDSLEVHYPSVHFDGTTYRMWYLGRNQVGAYGQIGLATSTDGTNWTKRAEPVFGTVNSRTPGTVIKVGTNFVMWYVDQWYDIGSASSLDGISWTDLGEITSPSMTSYQLTRPTVILDGATYRMLYMRYSSGTDIYPNAMGATNPTDMSGGASLEMTNATIAYASSSDGRDWTFYNGNPVLVMGPSAWDSPGVGQPSIIKDGSAFKMWYTGGVIINGNRVQGSIGYAINGYDEGATTLYASFTNAGIWQWGGSSWAQLTPDNPETIVAAGTNLYGKFGNGIWQWNGSSWTKLTPDRPASMVASGSNLYGNFTGNGIWQWGGSSWSQLTPDNPESMVAADSNLYGKFGNGIWQWTGSGWTKLTPDRPADMVAAGSNLYGSFTGSGIWQWNGSGWSLLTPDIPEAMAAAGSNLYGKFGNGIWQWNGSGWTKLTPDKPASMAAAGSNLYGSFTGNGIWQWNGSGWTQLTPDNPALMAVGD